MFRAMLTVVCLLLAECAFAGKDTLSVFFPFNKYALTDEMRNKLDDAMFAGQLSDRAPLSIIGYADEVGTNAYNLDLSRRRAEEIKAYLVQSGFRPALIRLLLGKGEQGAGAAGPDGRLEDRRVDIIQADPVRAPQAVADKPVWHPVIPAGTTPVAIGTLKMSTTDISTVKEGQTILLDNIYFYPGRHIVRNESAPTLDALYAALVAHPQVKVRIEGHVCCVSPGVADAMDDDTNMMELSVTRAEAIRDYLIKRGIPKDRLQYTGFGHRHPVVLPELSEDEADKNRRVEIRIIK